MLYTLLGLMQYQITNVLSQNVNKPKLSDLQSKMSPLPCPSKNKLLYSNAIYESNMYAPHMTTLSTGKKIPATDAAENYTTDRAEREREGRGRRAC